MLELQTLGDKNFYKSVTNDFSSFHTNAQIQDDAVELWIDFLWHICVFIDAIFMIMYDTNNGSYSLRFK